MPTKHPSLTSYDVSFRSPSVGDAAAVWRIARDCESLDLNSSYAYLLWCAHFSATSSVAVVGGEAVGFVTGYVPPDQPDTLMIWQIAVRDDARGRGIAQALLDSVTDRQQGIRWLKTTIAQSNTASRALFTAFADGRAAIISRTCMFSTSDFPDQHEPEDLYVIGPLTK
jgi:diaminobutyrate acetyltransferase